MYSNLLRDISLTKSQNHNNVNVNKLFARDFFILYKSTIFCL